MVVVILQAMIPAFPLVLWAETAVIRGMAALHGSFWDAITRRCSEGWLTYDTTCADSSATRGDGPLSESRQRGVCQGELIVTCPTVHVC